MIDMKEDFIEFQNYFKGYQQRFGLTGYKVFFRHESLEDCFAGIAIEQKGMVATVSLNSNLSDGDKPFKDIKQSAKHEAIHLLLNRLGHRARCRYVTEEEIYEAVEELVIKLENLIGE